MSSFLINIKFLYNVCVCLCEKERTDDDYSNSFLISIRLIASKFEFRYHN